MLIGLVTFFRRSITSKVFKKGQTVTEKRKRHMELVLAEIIFSKLSNCIYRLLIKESKELQRTFCKFEQ